MKAGKNKPGLYTVLLYIFYISFLVSLVYSFRAISSISVGAILLVGLLTFRSVFPIKFDKIPLLLVLGCLIYFLITLASQLYTKNPDLGWDHVRLKSGIIVTPLAGLLTMGFIKIHRHKLMLSFTAIVFSACLYCVGFKLLDQAPALSFQSFFYHELVSPLNQHAVYFSIYVFIALVFLCEYSRIASSRIRIYLLLLICFSSAFLIILASKLVIIAYLLYLFSLLINFWLKERSRRVMTGLLAIVFVVCTGLLLFTNNPISNRFKEIMNGDINISRKEKFEPSDYIDGLELRLIQFRFVTEILEKEKSWVVGVSPGDAQSFLDKKYISTNMYIGDPVRGDRGLLGYNTHNQFLQSLLQLGTIGLISFGFIWVIAFTIVWQTKNRAYTTVVLLLLAYACVESVFETQFGIVIFCFFPLFLFVPADFADQIHRRSTQIGR